MKIFIIITCFIIWFLTQWGLARLRQNLPENYDAIHEWTKKLNVYFSTHRRPCNFMLISSSLVIDALALFIVAISIWGESFRPFVAFMILFVLRQISQALVTLPIPQGNIWYDPGFPSLTVTYKIANDLFFSGHTGLAVLGGLEMIHLGYLPLSILAGAIIVYQTFVVLVLRAHWTADVICGYFAAISAYFMSFHFTLPV